VLIRTDAAGTPIDILGRMNDRGKKADANKNDHIYTIQVMLNEPAVGQAQFRIAAKFNDVLLKSKDDDEDWDKELAALNDPRAKGSRRDRLPPLLRKLQRYTLSDPIQVNVWSKYSDANASITFVYPPIPGTVPRINLDNNGIISFELSTPDGTYMPAFYMAVRSTGVTTSINDWFSQNVDDTGTLLVSTYTELDLSDGRAMLFLSGAVPTDWDGGPVAEAYVMSPDHSRITIVHISQDNPLAYDGLSPDQIVSLVDSIVNSIEFR
jgi:hypothetical protein